ncbi:hypothetical protein ACRS85_00795 [Pluralibacter gergoviae]|uniref:hypothetical protein n=1 Tax=Pluralibacter gergoviae TaxID=61647 RepID=UPI003EE19939
MQVGEAVNGNNAPELYNVDRVSKSEGLDRLPADYSKLPPPLTAKVPELGPLLPNDLGPASTAAQPADPNAVQNRHEQKEAFQKAGTT